MSGKGCRKVRLKRKKKEKKFKKIRGKTYLWSASLSSFESLTRSRPEIQESSSGPYLLVSMFDHIATELHDLWSTILSTTDSGDPSGPVKKNGHFQLSFALKGLG